jgi:hypoxanthine phosphoribosyltransferase
VAIQTLLDEQTLRARIRELGEAIRRDHGPGTVVHLVAVLKGALVFLADLMRVIDGPVTCDLIAVSSYGAGRNSSGEVKLTKDLDHALHGRHVVVVEDIVDTGLTLSYLKEILQAREPHSLRTACLLSKPSRRTVDVDVDYIGFSIEDRFVVGYGLDFNQQYRNLPYIAVLDEGAEADAGRSVR